jgi:hypothetical protein
VWYKRLGKGSAAVLLINADTKPQDVTVTWADLPEMGAPIACSVRSIWEHEDLGVIDGGYTAKMLESHDSVFLIISPA